MSACHGGLGCVRIITIINKYLVGCMVNWRISAVRVISLQSEYRRRVTTRAMTQ